MFYTTSFGYNPNHSYNFSPACRPKWNTRLVTHTSYPCVGFRDTARPWNPKSDWSNPTNSLRDHTLRDGWIETYRVESIIYTRPRSAYQQAMTNENAFRDNAVQGGGDGESRSDRAKSKIAAIVFSVLFGLATSALLGLSIYTFVIGITPIGIPLLLVAGFFGGLMGIGIHGSLQKDEEHD